MKKINLKTGLVILAVYEILYWMALNLFGFYGSTISGSEEYNIFMWSVGVPVAAIVIYFLISWASKIKKSIL